MAITLPTLSGRFVGIVAEEHQAWPEWSRLWPHLGINYVATAADEVGYDVALHDEFIEGYAPLEDMVGEGDVVGISLVITGLARGVELARRSKQLGARYVVAGNDAAMFAAKKLLALPDKPFDAVFLSNSMVAVRQFLRGIKTLPIEELKIRHVATDLSLAPAITNEPHSLEWQKRNYAQADFFEVPNLSLFGAGYWDRVWTAYRNQFGHKHRHPKQVKNALALLSQGCGRAAAGRACEFCSIGGGLANLVMPSITHLERTIEQYREFGIDTFFNVADSSIEMRPLAEALAEIGPVPALVMYGRAQVITSRTLDTWQDAASERILINCGMESGDEAILKVGVGKAASKRGSRLEENRSALRAIRAAGEKIHLHASVIFGSPGETVESCERTLELVYETIDQLGPTGQIDIIESDYWWVNEGAPCARILRDFDYARRLAGLAGKDLSREAWQGEIAPHAGALTLTDRCQEAWYRHFTHISPGTASDYIKAVSERMAQVPGAVPARNFNFLPS